MTADSDPMLFHKVWGMIRAAAARFAGMDRQALRDAVVRYNGEGLQGLHDRPKGHPPRRRNVCGPSTPILGSKGYFIGSMVLYQNTLIETHGP